MENKKAIVTGGTGRIGFAIVEGLLKEGVDVVIVCKNEKKARKVLENLRGRFKGRSIDYAIVDLGRKVEIKEFAQGWKGRLDILINNAAITPKTREETAEGIERQFAVNVLGYMWMIEYLEPYLRKAESARVINVASYWAGDLDLSDLEFVRRPYDNNRAYRQSKQCDRMLTKAFSTKLKKENISVNSCHPGDVNSPLSNSLGFGGHETPEEGARTPLWLALDRESGKYTGMYFEDRMPVRCPFSEDTESVRELYRLCKRY